MRKTIILFIVLFIISLFIKLPRYKELNNLKIIDKIYVYCDYYKLREVILNKDDFELEYKYYKEKNIDRNRYYIDKSKKIYACKK